jgi:hypothetical protein
MRHDGFLDFGNLPEDLQRRAILRILDRGEHDKVLVELNGDTRSAQNWILRTLQEREPTATPEQLAPYTLDAYRERLLSLYASIAHVDAQPPSHLEKHLVLAQFLHPERFQFLQTA